MATIYDHLYSNYENSEMFNSISDETKIIDQFYSCSNVLTINEFRRPWATARKCSRDRQTGAPHISRCDMPQTWLHKLLDLRRLFLEVRANLGRSLSIFRLVWGDGIICRSCVLQPYDVHAINKYLIAN